MTICTGIVVTTKYKANLEMIRFSDQVGRINYPAVLALTIYMERKEMTSFGISLILILE
jgi:hypothetical protein